MFMVLFLSSQPQALTKLERRVVGEWDGGSDWTLHYDADHTFRTSDDQFVGTWRVDSGRLHLRYWRPYDWDGSIRDHAERLFEGQPVNQEAWAMALADDNATMNLSLPGDSMALTRAD
jgi:hypothetical protein